jgi:hypothetical protein
MSETKHVRFGKAEQKRLDDVVRKLAAEQNAAVEAQLERRLSYRDDGKVQWLAYIRFLLSNGHTIYINLRTMEGSVSKKPDKFAQAKVKKREKKAAARAAKTAAPKLPRVKFDKKLPTLSGGGRMVRKVNDDRATE